MFFLSKQSLISRGRISILPPFLCCLFWAGSLFAQTSDDQFREPLVSVIHQIENRYHIKIRYPEALVKDRLVTYAGWRFRPDFKETMDNIFSSQDITWTEDGAQKYKLDAYKYHLKSEEEGQQQLDYLASLYHDKASWELRKDSLRACILARLGLDHRPQNAWKLARVTPLRKLNGYTVQNIALETMPGLYVCGSLYEPEKFKGKIPVVLNPDGHFSRGRYREDCQYRCGMQALLGCMSFSYDLFGWDGESLLQVGPDDHRRSLVQSIHNYNAMCILDYLLSRKEADPSRVAITGASGGGSHTMLMSAIDPRITLSIPVVMMSSYHSGGCPCESGMGVHLCGGGTNNAEIGAMIAPKPMLIVSDGKDWTHNTPKSEYPFVQRIYGFYNAVNQVENKHLGNEGHDYGPSKRQAAYDFLARQFHLNTKGLQNAEGQFNEKLVTIEPEKNLYVFGDKGELLPPTALHGYELIASKFNSFIHPR